MVHNHSWTGSFPFGAVPQGIPNFGNLTANISKTVSRRLAASAAAAAAAATTTTTTTTTNVRIIVLLSHSCGALTKSTSKTVTHLNADVC